MYCRAILLAVVVTTPAQAENDIEQRCGAAIHVMGDRSKARAAQQDAAQFVMENCAPEKLAAIKTCLSMFQMAGDTAITPEQRQLAADFFRKNCM